MSKVSELSNELYEILGEGYGFNGSKEDAIKIIDEKLTDLAKFYADRAFVAGRSKQSWKIFYLHEFI